MRVVKIDNSELKKSVTLEILSTLQGWFDREASNLEYAETSRDLPYFCAYDGKKSVGFLSLKETSSDCMEIYVMGVRKPYHHTGIGRALVKEAESFAEKKRYTLLQVKTVNEGMYREYDATNSFYQAMGFKKLECFPDMWDKANPCLIYVKML